MFLIIYRRIWEIRFSNNNNNKTTQTDYKVHILKNAKLYMILWEQKTNNVLWKWKKKQSPQIYALQDSRKNEKTKNNHNI